MTVSTRDESWPTWLLAGLFAVALVLLVTALLLWLRRPPSAGREAGVPTTAEVARVAPATETARPPLGAEGTAKPAPTGVEAPASPTVGPITPSQPAAVAARATGTPAPRPPATPTVAAAATATSAVAMPLVAPGEDAGTVEGQLTLEGRTQFSGITLLVSETPAATTDASGAFRLTVPAGLYTVAARYPGYMSIEAARVEVQAGEITQLPAAVLRAGDTDEDGDVDLFDVVRCVISLGQASTAHADVNGDGTVDFRDVILTQRNYRGASPVPWRASGQ